MISLCKKMNIIYNIIIQSLMQTVWSDVLFTNESIVWTVLFGELLYLNQFIKLYWTT